MEALFSYYHILVLLLCLVWSLLFFTKPDIRREMIVLGALALFLLPLAFTVNTATVDEVQAGFRQLSVLDLLFSFVLAGIAGGVFHAVFGKHYHLLPRPKRMVRTHQPFAQYWLLHLLLAFLLFSWSAVLVSVLFSVSVPTSVAFASLLLTVYIVSHRNDLLVDALTSAFLTATVVFISSWIASAFTGVDFTVAPIVSSATFLSVPVDLLVWSAALGLAIGPLYEFIRRFELSS